MAGMWPGVFARPARSRPRTSTKTCTAASSATTTAASLQRLRELSRRQLAEQARPAFHDPRLDELLFRYRARNLDLDDQQRDLPAGQLLVST
jgi:exodeoxyribonuclease I